MGTGLAATGVVWLGLGLAIGGGGQASAGQSRTDAGIAPRVTVDADRLMDVVRELASAEYQGRRTGSAGHARARAFIERRFRAAGLRPVGGRFARPFSLSAPGSRAEATGGASLLDANALEGVNVVGLCPAGTPEAPYLLVGAHYDHLGTRDGVVYSGADDNASGIAVLLALAETCGHVTRRHTLLIVGFDAEELGLAGARALVAEPVVPLDELRLMVNLDMVGRSERSSSRPVSRTRPALRPSSSAYGRARRSRSVSGTTRQGRRATTGRTCRTTAPSTTRACPSSTSASRITATTTSPPTPPTASMPPSCAMRPSPSSTRLTNWTASWLRGSARSEAVGGTRLTRAEVRL